MISLANDRDMKITQETHYWMQFDSACKGLILFINLEKRVNSWRNL